MQVMTVRVLRVRVRVRVQSYKSSESHASQEGVRERMIKIQLRSDQMRLDEAVTLKVRGSLQQGDFSREE